MKILAIEKEICPLMLEEKNILMLEQTTAIYDFYKNGKIREIYHMDNSKLVVLILECISLREARNYLSKLPLVRTGNSIFDVIILESYKGWPNLNI